MNYVRTCYIILKSVYQEYLVDIHPEGTIGITPKRMDILKEERPGVFFQDICHCTDCQQVSDL